MASGSREVRFMGYVNGVFSAWTSYTTVMGEIADNADAKDRWMRSTVGEFVYKNGGQMAEEELVEWMDDILNDEFDSIFEDGSVETTANILLAVRRHFFAEDVAALDSLLDNVRASCNSYKPSSSVMKDDSADEEEEEKEMMPPPRRSARLMKEDNTAKEEDERMDEEEEGPSESPEDDGWTHVGRQGGRTKK